MGIELWQALFNLALCGRESSRALDAYRAPIILVGSSHPRDVSYRTHQRLSEQTHLVFAVTLAGPPVPLEATITLDGQPIASEVGYRLAGISSVVSHPKGESFSTNLFIWYGEHNLGIIALPRSKGILAIQANPQAALLSIRGPEFTLTLTNTWGMTSSVPTDAYQIEAQYPHWADSREVVVNPDATAAWLFPPSWDLLSLRVTARVLPFLIAG